jgi:hypothetical protein
MVGTSETVWSYIVHIYPQLILVQIFMFIGSGLEFFVSFILQLSWLILHWFCGVYLVWSKILMKLVWTLGGWKFDADHCCGHETAIPCQIWVPVPKSVTAMMMEQQTTKESHSWLSKAAPTNKSQKQRVGAGRLLESQSF